MYTVVFDPELLRRRTVSQWREVLRLKPLDFLVKQTWIKGNGPAHDEALRDVLMERVRDGELVPVGAPTSAVLGKRARDMGS